MTSPTDTEAAASRDARHGAGAWITLAVIGLAVIVLLVLPGFLAGGFSRMDNDILSVNGDVNWDQCRIVPGMLLRYRLEFTILTPSGCLMKHSSLIRQFYNWEYRSIRGLDTTMPPGWRPYGPSS